MKKIILSSFIGLALMATSVNVAEAKAVKKPVPRAHAICRDGTISYSVARSGTCSHHKGVRKWLY